MKFILNYYTNILNIFSKHILILLTVISAFLTPIRPLLFIVGFMIFIDTLTGVIRSKKLNQPITSRKLSQIITKMLLYQGAIISLYFIDKLLLGEFISLFTSITLFLTKVGAITLVFIETKSINENITQATGVNVWDVFKQMLSRAKYIKDDIAALATTNKPDSNI